MKSLCITGSQQPDLDRLAAILHQAGMKAAQPARGAEPVDLARWHQHVIETAREDTEELHAIEHPGRLWEQLAGEIFVANINAKIWGWADPQSLWLLDFWAAYEPRLSFILVCTTPEQMLATAISTGQAIDSIEQLMDTWQTHHQQLLRFHHRHPQRSLLIDVRDAAAHPGALVNRCATQWKLPLQLDDNSHPGQIITDTPLVQYLAHDFCQTYPHTASLQSELAATIVPLGTAPTATTTPGNLIADYHHLKDRSAEQAQRVALEKANQQLSQAKTTLEQEKSALAARRDALEKANQQLTQARDAQTQLANERQAQIQQLSQAKTTLEQEKSALAARRDALEKANQQLNQQLTQSLQQAKTDGDALRSKHTEATQENELLLLQLHQVQEELEHYFLQHQEARQHLKDADTRWQRMLQRTPDYLDYTALEIIDADADTAHWQITALETADRRLPLLKFSTLIEQGHAGYQLQQEHNGLTRWPAQAAPGQPLVIIPVGDKDTAAARIETLLDLATSDWKLLQRLTQLITQTLDNPARLKDNAPATFSAAPLRPALAKLQEFFAKFPAVPRYDHVSLKNEQTNPDYEHLWLHFDHFSCGTQHCAGFEFRLSCANVGPRSFGTQPKLEFPAESGQAPFEAWFAESHDDLGAKLELRFALPNAMDTAVWQRITAHDRNLINQLVARLPSMLATLQQAGVSLNRPWADWIQMAHEMQRILIAHIAAPAQAQ